MRDWVDEYVRPYVQEWEETGTYPLELYQRAARDGLLMPFAAGRKIPEEWHGVFPIIGDIDPKEWNGFHDVILHDEFGRVGGVGVQNSLLGTIILPVPAIQRFANPQLRRTILSDIFHGKKRLCLAITEPDAGSDVRGIQTTAKISADGQKFIVNGQKKWITGGMYADYFLTLVNDEAVEGKSLVIIERSPGLTTKHMKTSGSGAAGTAFVDFDEVEVPIANVVGERGQGLKYTMSNFNHERLFIGIQAIRCARVCLEDSIQHAQSRVTFDRLLAEQPVIRYKIAHMSRETEAAWAWMESLVYQIDSMPAGEAELLLAGTTAHFKAHACIVLEHVVREAVQIMGGLGLTRGGKGARIEQIWRDCKALTIPGGSEEILLDFAVKRAFKTQGIIKNSAKI